MKIYLLRHGKTVEHENRVRQHPGSDLGKEGKKQAKKVAKRLVEEPIDVIISSPWPRALTTAQIVGQKLGMQIDLDDQLHELINNPVLNGLAYEHELNKRFQEEIGKEGQHVDWKFLGEGESVRNVIHRVKKFKQELLEKYPNKNILIVSHGYILATLIALFLTGEKVDDQSLKNIITSLLSFENTSVSLLEYHELRQSWRLMYFNDFSHLN